MKTLCKNSEYEYCYEEVNTKDQLCDNCCEEAYEAYLDAFYGGSSPMTTTERHNLTSQETQKIG